MVSCWSAALYRYSPSEGGVAGHCTCVKSQSLCEDRDTASHFFKLGVRPRPSSSRHLVSGRNVVEPRGPNCSRPSVEYRANWKRKSEKNKCMNFLLLRKSEKNPTTWGISITNNKKNNNINNNKNKQNPQRSSVKLTQLWALHIHYWIKRTFIYPRGEVISDCTY